MAAEIKSIKFLEGVTVTAPTPQPVAVGTATLDAHATTLLQVTTAIATAKAEAITAAINALVDGAPAALDTLNELAAALADDAAFSTTVMTALANRLRVDTAAQGLTNTEKTNAKTNIDLQNVPNVDATNPANITQDASYRFVTDAEKTTWNGKESAITATTSADYYRGDKTFQPLNKAAVGLDQVDNTSDATKNSAIATLTNKTFDKFQLQEVADNATGANATLTAPSMGVIILTNASLTSVDMIPAVSGMVMMLMNKTGVQITLNNNTGATAANRILTGTSANLSVPIDGTVFMYYSATASRWQVVGGSGSGGSSASASVNLDWKKNGTSSPMKTIVDGMDVEEFSNSESQEIYATIKVPESYSGGSLISLRGLSFYSSLTTGNVLFKTQATLLKSGSSVIGIYTNQRTSTNSQVAVAGVANTLTEVGALDLTDTSGLINGVAVLGGDKIRVRLYRDIASETSGLASEAKLLIDAAEIKL